MSRKEPTSIHLSRSQSLDRIRKHAFGILREIKYLEARMGPEPKAAAQMQMRHRRIRLNVDEITLTLVGLDALNTRVEAIGR